MGGGGVAGHFGHHLPQHQHQMDEDSAVMALKQLSDQVRLGAGCVGLMNRINYVYQGGTDSYEF